MIEHDGRAIPTFPARWDPSNVEWVTVAWADAVALYGDISTSEWEIPDEWEKLDTRKDVTVEDADGTEREHCNQLQAQTSAKSGLHVLTNRVVFADGTDLSRSVRVIVSDT